MQKIEFTKMHGLGNDFVIIDRRSKKIEINENIIHKLSDRRTGAGCDQLITINDPQNENVDWLDEIQLIKDKDLAFARLLQFKAFSEVGIALASRIRENETSISAFKYYQTLNLLNCFYRCNLLLKNY